MQIAQKPSAVVVTPAANNGQPLEVKRAAIAAAGAGNNTLVAAVTGKQIRVIGFSFVCAGAVTVRFEDGAGGTALTGQMEFAANGGIAPPEAQSGHFQTSSATLLNLELSGAVSVAGWLNYVEV